MNKQGEPHIYALANTHRARHAPAPRNAYQRMLRSCVALPKGNSTLDVSIVTSVANSGSYVSPYGLDSGIVCHTGQLRKPIEFFGATICVFHMGGSKHTEGPFKANRCDSAMPIRLERGRIIALVVVIFYHHPIRMRSVDDFPSGSACIHISDFLSLGISLR